MSKSIMVDGVKRRPRLTLAGVIAGRVDGVGRLEVRIFGRNQWTSTRDTPGRPAARTVGAACLSASAGAAPRVSWALAARTPHCVQCDVFWDQK